ncbi:MAG: glycosyltransferase [Desulfobacteraceae bacterium 4572_88]|nr:MAG: glycosyltransferase [Desulfobacteraceae bacterium 4572_88]
MKKKLSIVFLNYNRLEETRQTVSQLRELVANRNDAEVIAVNNASDDGTGEYLQTQSDWLTLADLKHNSGIAGLNEGFRKAEGKYILVLDDDSHPCDGVTLDRMIACLDTRPDVGVVACRIEHPDGQPFRTWHLPKKDIPGPCMAFVGCGFAIRRELFGRIGWYPGHFFLYQNEMEVAIRVMREGYEIFYEPSCRVVHRESPAGRGNWRRVYFPTRNTVWIIRRYFPFRESLCMIASRLCMGLVRAIQFRELGCYLRAVRDAFGELIEPEILPRQLRRKLVEFRRQNSLWCQVMVIIRHRSAP